MATELIKVTKGIIEWLSNHESTTVSNVNELMFLIKPDVVKRLEMINMVVVRTDYELQDELFDDLISGLKNCFVDDITYDSFITCIALIQYYLIILKDKDAPNYRDRLTLEVANVLSHLEINPYEALNKLTLERKHKAVLELEVSFALGMITGMIIHLVIRHYLW